MDHTIRDCIKVRAVGAREGDDLPYNGDTRAILGKGNLSSETTQQWLRDGKGNRIGNQPENFSGRRRPAPHKPDLIDSKNGKMAESLG